MRRLGTLWNAETFREDHESSKMVAQGAPSNQSLTTLKFSYSFVTVPQNVP
jgi:hypothetical protein